MSAPSTSQTIEQHMESAQASVPRFLRDSLFGCSILIGAGLALATGSALPALGRELFLRLEMLFHVIPSQMPEQIGVASIAFVLLVVLASSLIGRLSLVPRSIGWLQLFVLSLLAHWFFLTAHLAVQPIAVFSAIVYGGIIGYGWRLFSIYEQKKQSRYFEIILRNKELQEARLQMIKQDEVDRRLLAGDLHDQVLNDLKILNQKFQSHRQEPSDESASEIDELLHQAMNGVRDVMDSLSPAVIEHLGFAAGVEDCLRRAGERGGFKVRTKREGAVDDFSKLDLIEQTLLFRLIQECGNNITKHAKATSVKLQLALDDDVVVIRVTDNGVGIPEGVNVNDSRGLKYMRLRGDLIGATIAWLAGEGGKGTTVEIKLPLRKTTND